MYYLLCNKIDGIWLYFWLCLIHTWRSVLYRSARALHSSILNTKRSIWNMNICINISMYTHIFFSMYVYAYIYIYIYIHIYLFIYWKLNYRYQIFSILIGLPDTGYQFMNILSCIWSKSSNVFAMFSFCLFDFFLWCIYAKKYIPVTTIWKHWNSPFESIFFLALLPPPWILIIYAMPSAKNWLL